MTLRTGPDTAGIGTSRPILPNVDGAIEDATVLVVDDNESNVVLLERLLNRAGIVDIVGVTDSRQVVQRYHDCHPDLILLDLHMPHLDGFAVMEALASVIPSQSFVPIVVLTADATDQAKQRALSCGAKDFLTKPFAHTEVVLRVNNLLETRAMHLQLQQHNADLRAEISRRTATERQVAEQLQASHDRIASQLATGSIEMVFQPIVSVPTLRLVGVEALARFEGTPTPDKWFEEAKTVGLDTDLELLAVRSAVEQLDQFPPGTYMSINVSPTTAIDAGLVAVIEPVADRVVLELTEHEQVKGYPELAAALDHLRSIGARLAVDDAGSGYSSLQHILRLRPDIIKLDIDLTRGIDIDPARRALAAALVGFASEINATITAEGIETSSELDTITHLGVDCAQGYHLGRPSPLPPR